MSQFGKIRGVLMRLLLLTGLVIVAMIPVRSWAVAQSSTAPIWVVRTVSTSEFGISEPKGLAFSFAANTFLILDEAGKVVLITMGEDNAGSSEIPEVEIDPLNTAFDNSTDSLFVLNRGKSEIAKIKSDDKGLPTVSAGATRFAVHALGTKEPQGIAFDEGTGSLLILDAGNSEIISVAPHPTLGFDADEAIRSNKVQRISLNNLGTGLFRGIAHNAGNGHLYVSEPEQKKLYELTQNGDLVSVYDLASLGINNPSAMAFAPSADNTDDPNIQNLFILDTGTDSIDEQIVEVSLSAPAALPPGVTLLNTNVVHVIDTSKAAWNPSAPDPAGVDYWPLTGRLLISDSEVEEMPAYWTGKNVFQSTTSGTLGNTCSTTSFSNEPTGLAINPNNNHIFFSDDSGSNDKVFEVTLGADGKYCTADDTVTINNVAALYGANDAEDVAYGNNTLFIADGINAEVYRIPLGANGVLGGGDDGATSHFDTAALGFNNIEGIGYKADSGTLLIVGTGSDNRYLGEISTNGMLLRAYNLAYSGLTHREDVTYAPSSQNSSLKNVYITDRGVDNDSNSNENDGEVWEISISSAGTSTPTATSNPGPSPTPTNTPSSSDLIFADGFESGSFSAWSANKTDSGDLGVSAAAALVGTRGMQALIDDTVTIFVTDDRPNAEPRYRVRFYFDPNSITMASGNAHFIFNGLAGTSTAILRVEFRFFSGAYQVRGRLVNDATTWTNTNWFTISNGPHSIELDWRASTGAGANNGGLTFWIDGTQQANLTGIDNDTRRMDRVRLGAVAGIDAGTSGTYYFDAFESRRQTFIGP